MARTSYQVTGMTCAHCVAAVTEEVGLVAGVTEVDVDLESGSLLVGSEGEVARQAVADAVDEAGYALVDA